jgi:DNA-binding transcriptional regulator/RsmH inhibitor MraZ
MLNNYPAHLDEKNRVSFEMESREALENSAINVLFKVGNTNDYSE